MESPLKDPRLLVDALVTERQDGTPVVVVVLSYPERTAAAELLTGEAAIHGIDAVTLFTLEEADRGVPLLSPDRNAAILLIDPEQGAAWGEWLQANREQLPQWTRFLLILAMEPDLPSLLTPAFFSWAKGNIVRLQPGPTNLSTRELEDELQAMQRQYSMTPAEFIEAWQRGEIPDTFQTSAWLGLAYAWSESHK